MNQHPLGVSRDYLRIHQPLRIPPRPQIRAIELEVEARLRHLLHLHLESHLCQFCPLTPHSQPNRIITRVIQYTRRRGKRYPMPNPRNKPSILIPVHEQLCTVHHRRRFRCTQHECKRHVEASRDIERGYRGVEFHTRATEAGRRRVDVPS